MTPEITNATSQSPTSMTEPQDAQQPGTTPDDMQDGNKSETPVSDAILPVHIEKANTVEKDAPSEDSSTDDVTTRIFRFLATATPGTLGGVAVGLVSVTYLVLGQIGLLLVGAFAGAVALIQWEGRNPEVSRAIRGERGVDLLERLLGETKDGKMRATEERNLDEQERALARGLDDFRPETREALTELVDAIIKDYVRWWYSPIMPSDKFFPLSCRKVLTSFLVSASTHLGRKRPADAFLDFLTNSSSIVIVFLSELSSAFADLPADSRAPVRDIVYNYLASNPDSNLSNLLSQRQQAGKLRMVAEDLLTFLDRSTYECDPARVFLREILAGVVLESTLQTCSKPEWINGWIVYLLEAGEPDFNQAIDVGMQTGPGLDTAFVGIDGNVGNIGLSKGNRNSFETERSRRKQATAHKKKLSKADEEMELAMEEMKRMNQMIEEEEARRSKQSKTDVNGNHAPSAPNGTPGEAIISSKDASERLTDALKRNADSLDIDKKDVEKLTAEAVQQPVDFTTNPSPSTAEAAHTPLSPVSNTDLSSQSSSSPQQSTGSRFTSFDQIVPPAREELEGDGEEASKPRQLTLHNATITVLDEPGDNRIRSKPSWDYLIQIEPATTQYPGWMIVRKYSDFEPLHEVLRRIATISGATAFTEQHKELPMWKVHTRSSLRGELERYLREACWNQSLAECEGMKKFLEKDQRYPQGNNKLGFQAFEKIGKNVFDVLTSAPVEGSKAVVGGVTGVLGNIGLGQRKPTSSSLQDVTAASRLSISTPPRPDSGLFLNGARKRDSMDSQRSSVVSMQPGKVPPMERRPSYNSQADTDPDSRRASRIDRAERSPVSGMNSREHSRASSLAPLRSPSTLSLEGMRLPPPPDAVPDDYEPYLSPTSRQPENFRTSPMLSHQRTQTMPNLGQKSTTIQLPKPAKQHSELSEQETRVAVELLFAVINELYTLSSAWNIRRTLLAAAKSFLLRPGNPSLVSIRTMIQSSVVDANASDAGVAAHLRKLRQNSLPTEEERAAWPAEMSAEEKEKLRVKARRLLIESGVPDALSGVMGQSATSEALGRVFDCLQVEEVARGLMFGIMLQAVRIVTH